VWDPEFLLAVHQAGAAYTEARRPMWPAAHPIDVLQHLQDVRPCDLRQRLAAGGDLMMSATCDPGAAEGVCRAVLQASRTPTPRVITIDKRTAYPPAFETLQPQSSLPVS
jgi:hypothetical protein